MMTDGLRCRNARQVGKSLPAKEKTTEATEQQKEMKGIKDMLNQDRFKTPEERVKAHEEWCSASNECRRDDIVNCRNCFAHWLALEAEEEKPEPCFYCGAEMHYRTTRINSNNIHWLECTNSKCNFESPKYGSKERAISEHNRMARAARGEGGAE